MFGEPPPSQGDLFFSVFGIPVRVHPWFWLITVMMALGTGNRKVEPIVVVSWVAASFISILVHELGHAFAARAYGWPPRITLYGMGGLASYSPTHRDPRAQILIAFAGPAAGFVLAGIIVAIILAMRHTIVFAFGGPGLIGWYADLGDTPERIQIFVFHMLFINIWWGLVNLLPIYPLDGGRISRELFSMSRTTNGLQESLQLSMIAAGAVAVYGAIILKSGFMALMFGYFAFTSYQAMQGFTGRGGGYGGRW